MKHEKDYILTEKYYRTGRWIPEKPPALPALNKALLGGLRTLRSGQPALPKCPMSLLTRSAPASCSPFATSSQEGLGQPGWRGGHLCNQETGGNWASHKTQTPLHMVPAPSELLWRLKQGRNQIWVARTLLTRYKFCRNSLSISMGGLNMNLKWSRNSMRK